ncbi:hypothetical protein LINPERPRIM_LOCUS32750 [Linum perenne]
MQQANCLAKLLTSSGSSPYSSSSLSGPWSPAPSLSNGLLAISPVSPTTSTFPTTTISTSSYVEVEEREKVVKHMWDVYMQSSGSTGKRRLPRFWEEAFEAAYEALISDLPNVRDAAVSEIAKMSLLSINLEPFSSVQSSKQPIM